MSLPLECLIARNEHGVYCVPKSSSHRPAALAILKGQVWEPDTLATIRRFAGGGDIVHAGAYFGDFLPAISRALDPSAKLWAFEPHPESFQAASITLRLNALVNVDLQALGLSDRVAKYPLLVKDHGECLGGGSRILRSELRKSEETVQISVAPLADLIPAHRAVSVLQLDVEGHEVAALAGARTIIQRWLPTIIIETLNEGWVAENLTPLGYHLIGRCHRNSVLSVSGSIGGKPC